MPNYATLRDPHDIFEILVRENADMLMVFLRSMVRDPGAVDDLFQDTMMTAWRRLDDFDRSRPFGPWLRGIGARLVMAHFRKAKKDFMLLNQPILERICQQMDGLDQHPHDTFDESIRQLRECIEALPAKLEQAISARYIRERSAEQAADHLGISREAIKKRLQRARSQLLDCLQRKNVLVGGSV